MPETHLIQTSASEPTPTDTSLAEAVSDGIFGAAPTPSTDTPPAASKDTSLGRALLFVLFVAILLLFLAPPLSTSGIWDPHELNVADLSRRIAVNLHGAKSLVLDGADNTLPHLNDLGRPQLAFTSIAIGFSWFGLHDWAGRAPLAVWGVLGALATFGFVSRLASRRAGMFAATALLAMPLYFVQARTMLGDIVPMAALAMSVGGLGVVVIDERPGFQRCLWLALGLLGIAAGVTSRGFLLGAAAPLLSIGLLGALMVSTSGEAKGSIAAATKISLFNPRVLFAFACLATSAVLFWKGYKAFAITEAKDDLNPYLGALVHPQTKYPTFDYFVGHLGPALAPWSAIVPLAWGRLFLAPKQDHSAAFVRESRLRALLFIASAVVFACHGFLAQKVDLIAFTGPALLAASIGLALRDFEKGAPASLGFGFVGVVFLALFHHDFHELPEKAYQAFGVASATFPESFKDRALLLWWITLGVFAATLLLAFAEGSSKRKPLQPSFYIATFQAIKTVWDGLLWLGYLALVAGASLAAIVVWIGNRVHFAPIVGLASNTRELLQTFWWKVALAPLGIFAAIFVTDLMLIGFCPSAAGERRTMLGRTKEALAQLRRHVTQPSPTADGKSMRFADDGERITALALLGSAIAVPTMASAYAIFRSGHLAFMPLALLSAPLLFGGFDLAGMALRESRAQFFLVVGITMSLVLGNVYFPALANQLSPKEVFQSYEHFKKGHEPLAMLGVGGKTSAYYAGSDPLALDTPQDAFSWLTAAPTGARRFVISRSEELSRMNQLYRARTQNNLPVLDGRSSQIVLVASELHAGEVNENPLEKIVMHEPPKLARALDVNLEDKLQLLGIDFTDAQGTLVDTVSVSKKFHFRSYYRVLAPIGMEWEAFIHIDGFHRRHNGDHKVCAGKYPMSLWQKGDVIMDDYEFSLEPNFADGDYTVFFGFWLGESRMKVKSGASDGDNRINAGMLRVR